jgi:hypothetical protein
MTLEKDADMDIQFVESVKKALKKLNPHVEEIINFTPDPDSGIGVDLDFEQCAEDIEKHKVDFIYICNLLDWAGHIERKEFYE